MFANSASKFEITQIPWASLTGIDFRDGTITLIGPNGSTAGGRTMSEKELGGSWTDYVARLQLNGSIPARIAVVTPQVQTHQTKSGKGSWAVPLLLIAIVVGVPFFKGGGSLAAKAKPRLNASSRPTRLAIFISTSPKCRPRKESSIFNYPHFAEDAVQSRRLLLSRHSPYDRRSDR
jgi:hypothetical protein